MGHLAELVISRRVINAAKPRRNTKNTAEYRRKKLIANIEEQIELARLSLNGEPVQLERKRGHRVITVKPRLWWAIEADGTVLTEIRYNKIPLNLASRGTTIEVADLARLPSALQTVIEAVRAGELDQSIETAARRSRA
jgi:hypothetical protein